MNKNLKTLDLLLERFSILIGSLIFFAFVLYFYYQTLVFNRYAGPFFDSVSYMNSVAYYHWMVKFEGLIPTILLIINGGSSTVTLPWIIVSIYSAIGVPLTRFHSIWIQLPFYLICFIFGYIHFKRQCQFSKFNSIIFAFSLISFSSIFSFNGGMFDLRMDLLQALTWTLFCLIFIQARKRYSIYLWIFLGLSISASCLVRATTPIYFLGFLPIFLVDTIMRKSRDLNLIKGYVLSLVISAIILIPIYYKNFSYLYYYYFEWNDDAHARLSFSESILHLTFLRNHVGTTSLYFLLIIFFMNLFDAFSNKKFLEKINYIPLIGFLFPILLLIFTGAGLNPFVSMISTPMLILFLFQPLQYDSLPNFHQKYYIQFLRIFSILFIVSNLFQNKLPAANEVSNKNNLLMLTQELISRADNDPDHKLNFTVGLVGSVNDYVIRNILIYEFGWAPIGDKLVKNNVSIFSKSLPLANKSEWNSVSGETDDDRAEQIVKDIISFSDLIIAPEKSTLIPEHYASVKHIFKINEEAIKAGKYQRISDPIQISKSEYVSLFMR